MYVYAIHCGTPWCTQGHINYVEWDNLLDLIAHLQQQCHNSKLVIFQLRCLRVLKCYTFLWVRRWHSCSPAVSFTNYVTLLYLLKEHLQTFSYTNNSKMPNFELWHSCRKWAISALTAYAVGRFQVLTPLLLKFPVIWHMMPCCLADSSVCFKWL